MSADIDVPYFYCEDSNTIICQTCGHTVRRTPKNNHKRLPVYIKPCPFCTQIKRVQETQSDKYSVDPTDRGEDPYPKEEDGDE